MSNRTDNLETVLMAIEMLRRIPRGRKITAAELHSQLQQAGFDRDLRTIQRQIERLSEHFGLERDDRSKPYGYRWPEQAQGLSLPSLTVQESLLLRLAEEHLRHLLPPRLMASMDGFFTQARRNLGPDKPAVLEKQWPDKVRVVATSQPLLPAPLADGVFEAVSEALFRNHWLEIDYRNAAGQPLAAQVMPLGLAQQGHNLYLVCRFKGFDDERLLALHRMRRARQTTLTFERPADFNLADFEADGRFGFGYGKQVRLTFQIKKPEGRHLLETPLSLDQTVEELDDAYRISATVIESEMLMWWLRKFGEDVTAIQLEPVDA